MPTFATPGPITATLTTAGARVRVVASGRADTVVRVEPVDRANTSDVMVAERSEVDFAGGELSVRTTQPGDRDGSVVIAVELPVGSRLMLNTAWSDVRADGLLGDCDLNTASGLVRLDRVAALRASLAAGSIEVGHVAGNVAVEGGAAGVRIGEATGSVRYQGSSGTVWIGHARSDIELVGSSGSFDIDRAEGGVAVKAGDCPIRIGQISRGRAELTNASGGIEIGISESTAASVDARSTKGAVRDFLPTRDSLGEFDDKVTVHARTRLGDIVIHRAAA